MRAPTSKAGLVAMSIGIGLVTGGVLLDQTASASDTNVSASPAATPTGTTTPSTAPCPPAPPDRRDRSDHGFPRLADVTGVTSTGLPIVKQPFTVELVCYDPEVQHATVTFTGIAPTGTHGQPLPILKGEATFVFTGHRSMAVVDATQTYRLDLTPLGQPAADGWHVRLRVDIAEDRSAYRDLPFVIAVPRTPTPSPTVAPTQTPTPTPTVVATQTPAATQSPTPTPTASSAPAVLPTKLTRTPTPTPTTQVKAVREVAPQVLPFTGARATGPLTWCGGGLVIVGALLALGGRRRKRA